VTPDPELPAPPGGLQPAPLKQFERHSALGSSTRQGFMQEVERLRKLGARRVTLKTGAYPCRAGHGESAVERRPASIC